ncbi:MAG: hypothetical protein IJ038_05895 [Clostridia bacterium]|nr:hypothetical protein [Clostridia bacterium]
MQITKKTNTLSDSRQKRLTLPNIPQILFSFACFFSLALIIKNSDVAIEYMSQGLELCAKTVIPSLFPFMVVSDVIVSSGVSSFAGKLLQAPMKLLFGVGGEGGCAVFLGTLCGFPIGAKSAVALYDAGKLSKNELERILTFSNNPSSAFIISAVGVSLFGSREFGKALYAITLLSAAATGILQNTVRKIKNRKKAPSNDAPTFEGGTSEKNAKTSFTAETFTNAVSSSALGTLKICAFVVFFSAFLGTLGLASDTAVIPQQLKALIFSVCELTGGTAQASAVIPDAHGAVIAAFASGWSGLSVHFQIMSLCAGRGISFKPYFLAKLFQGLSCSVLMFLYLKYISPDLLFHAESVSSSVLTDLGGGFAQIVCCVFAFAVICISAKRFFIKKG